MVAFEDPIRVREVEVRDEEVSHCENTEGILSCIYYWGQNDFQPLHCCSVSVGDVIELDPLTPDSVGCLDHEGGIEGPIDWTPGFWMVAGVGFYQITLEQFESHKALPRIDRSMNAYKLEPKEDKVEA